MKLLDFAREKEIKEVLLFLDKKIEELRKGGIEYKDLENFDKIVLCNLNSKKDIVDLFSKIFTKGLLEDFEDILTKQEMLDISKTDAADTFYFLDINLRLLERYTKKELLEDINIFNLEDLEVL